VDDGRGLSSQEVGEAAKIGHNTIEEQGIIKCRLRRKFLDSLPDWSTLLVFE
jgi:hypothetical protein